LILREEKPKQTKNNLETGKITRSKGGRGGGRRVKNKRLREG